MFLWLFSTLYHQSLFSFIFALSISVYLNQLSIVEIYKLNLSISSCHPQAFFKFVLKLVSLFHPPTFLDQCKTVDIYPSLAFHFLVFPVVLSRSSHKSVVISIVILRNILIFNSLYFSYTSEHLFGQLEPHRLSSLKVSKVLFRFCF